MTFDNKEVRYAVAELIGYASGAAIFANLGPVVKIGLIERLNKVARLTDNDPVDIELGNRP